MPLFGKNRLELLEKENRELRERLEALEARLQPTPGLEGARERWTIQVGGEPVELRALTDEQWVMALGELPSFLLEYSVAKAARKGDDAALLKRLHQTAQQWILACAVGEVKLHRLTVPEAREALTVISRLNGVDSALREFLHQRLVVDAPRSGSDPLRPATERPARSN